MNNLRVRNLILMTTLLVGGNTSSLAFAKTSQIINKPANKIHIDGLDEELDRMDSKVESPKKNIAIAGPSQSLPVAQGSSSVAPRGDGRTKIIATTQTHHPVIQAVVNDLDAAKAAAAAKNIKGLDSAGVSEVAKKISDTSDVSELAIEGPESVTKGVRVEDIIEPTEVYHYAGAEKSDPFIAPIGTFDSTVSKVESVDAEEIPIVSPLQYYDLKVLSVTGVWESEKGKWKAMIETPDQQGIITKVHDSVGNSGGRITDISSNGVKVRQFKLKKDGSQEFSDHVIGMARETSGSNAVPGGTIVLKPGANSPEMHIPENAMETLRGNAVDADLVKKNQPKVATKENESDLRKDLDAKRDEAMRNAGTIAPVVSPVANPTNFPKPVSDSPMMVPNVEGVKP